ncbi:hypothetical protein [Tropicimonas marinistellae]|uniref:hypothetical protein n=1 Tax=Tropicimonas marinistellae TaxID=1739787 RepID=UPI0008357A3D|nr:hypothetical protein [Tropicimonas marinistellae]
MGFKILELVEITESDLVSSTVTENDATAWSDATTYSVGDEVMYDHRVWKSAADGNLDNTPSDSADEWADQGATERYRVFDNRLTPKVVEGSTITYVIDPPEAIDGVAVCFVTASSVTVSTSGGYSSTVTEQMVERDLLFDDLPSSTNRVTISIAVHSANARVGEICLGTMRDIGTCHEFDWETTYTDDAIAEMVQNYEFTVSVDSDEVASAKGRLMDLQGQWAVFSGAPSRPELGATVFGKLVPGNRFSVDPGPTSHGRIFVQSAP